METQKFIEKIFDICEEESVESARTMSRLVACFDKKSTAEFYKASGINELANRIQQLIIKEEGYFLTKN